MREKHSLDPINLNGKTVLVTGGTGSFGQRFTQLVLERYDLKKLIVLSRDEHKQYTMQQCPHFMNRPELRFFIGDIRDEKRLRMAMRDVDYVVHAAAMKHVPTTEYNPLECIHTNIHGAENIVSASIDCGVKRVIALSTDKAVNPINIYGASKFAADKIFVASNRLSGDGGTKFSVVRYGNVIGSRGSIVPLIQRLIQDKAPSLPLTDRRMTRFWISLDQGINFVLSSVQLMKGGEIFVPKIPSMKIADMMNTLAPDIPVRVVGLRPGEKIHEVLVSEEDTATVLELDDRFIICPPKTPNIQTSHEQDGAIIAPAGLRYASNNNKVWLDPHGLKQLLPASPH